eukprot:1625683-Rhodomonas_salina.1
MHCNENLADVKVEQASAAPLSLSADLQDRSAKDRDENFAARDQLKLQRQKAEEKAAERNSMPGVANIKTKKVGDSEADRQEVEKQPHAAQVRNKALEEEARRLREDAERREGGARMDVAERVEKDTELKELGWRVGKLEREKSQAEEKTVWMIEEVRTREKAQWIAEEALEGTKMELERAIEAGQGMHDAVFRQSVGLAEGLGMKLVRNHAGKDRKVVVVKVSQKGAAGSMGIQEAGRRSGGGGGGE